MHDFTTAAPEELGLSAPRLARIDAWRDAWVSSGRLPGMLTLVARHGRIAHLATSGHADLARGTLLAPDTIFRIYSMTKPLTTAALLMLYEEGRFQLDDPVARVLPYFADMRVFAGGNRGRIETRPAERPITIHDLLTHTAGLTYAFMDANLVDALYRDRGIDFQTSDATLASLVEQAASLPLLAQPGREWNYSIATDVLGHLVATIAGQPFDRFLQDRILTPLGMTDTAFQIPEAAIPRFAANYTPGPGNTLTLVDDPTASRFATRRLPSGGGGLVSTATDYLRFCQMLLNGGTLGTTRLLGRKTVALMTANHLPGDMAAMGQPRFSESSYAGIGFGLGVSVMLDPARAQILGSPGEYAWGGAASTAFWIDPAEDLIVILMTQLTPSSTHPIRRELRVLTYQALT